MRITKWIEPPQIEVEIDICGEDMIAALYSDPANYAPERLLKRAVNQLAEIIKNLPDEAVAALTPTVREMVHTFLLDQAKRFEAPAEGSGR